MNADCTEVAIPHEFESVWPFENGYAPFCEGGCWGYIDMKGAVVAQPKYEEARAFSEKLGACEIRRRMGIFG